MFDAIVVGSGPNGLAAAVTLARAGLLVAVYEANSTLGGGARTLERPNGSVYDWGSAVHPMAFASPFFREFELTKRVEFLVPEMSYAHILKPDHAVYAWKDLRRTMEGLGRDGDAWRRIMVPLMRHLDGILEFASSTPYSALRHPIASLAFSVQMLKTGTGLHKTVLKTEEARALLGGVFAHAVGKQPSIPTSAPGLMLASIAHKKGWPIPVGGSQSITNAMLDDLKKHGGVVFTDRQISAINDLPKAPIVIMDTSVPGLLNLMGDHLPTRYAKKLAAFKHAPGASKVDFTLSGPIPWRDPELQKTGTVHFGGTLTQIADSERLVMHGKYPDNPYLLLSQPSVLDQTRAPSPNQVVWAYNHVPAGSALDQTEIITAQIERAAPGFRDLILESHATPAHDIFLQNQNMIGGDLGIGALTLKQLLARPVNGRHPWRVPTIQHHDGGRTTRGASAYYLCSGATPPGPGVHGLGGYRAAALALRDVYGKKPPALGITT